MLNELQLMLLDNGHWILPALGFVAIIVFPWKQWNTLID